MRLPPLALSRTLRAAALLGLAFGAADLASAQSWQQQHDSLVARLRALKDKAGSFGPAYEPIYAATLPWYETWGGRNDKKVDDNMVSPEQYATELADALEHGRNFIADHPGSQWPLVFEKTLPGGKVVKCNYWLALPAGFPKGGQSFPLIVGLHGSGWLAHKISFVRGKGDGGATFGVVPIDEGGPWQLDFLNAYLDELESILPVDRDRVYLEGHSLGAMATWEWALNNPERFAAVSPRDGVGEPYRAIRLRNVPAWVIHGEKDDVIYPAYAEQMITAMRATGGTAKYSLLPNAPHNVPSDFDQASVVKWYLQQSRSHDPAPPDPREALGLNEHGISAWTLVTLPAAAYWQSGPTSPAEKRLITRPAELPLIKKVESKGLLVGSPIRQRYQPDLQTVTLWLAVPAEAGPDPSAKPGPLSVARYYFQGTYKDGLSRAKEITSQVAGSGKIPSGFVWITPLSLWQNTPRGIAEYWIELN
jgi:pimeloyl-ACP methyl ester carboxylesterase